MVRIKNYCKLKFIKFLVRENVLGYVNQFFTVVSVALAVYKTCFRVKKDPKFGRLLVKIDSSASIP